MTLPADMPDDYQWLLGGQRALLDDQAELAARLGSPVVWDRRGQVIWFDTFAHGLSAWKATGYGTGASVLTINNLTYLPGFAAELIAGSDGVAAAELQKEFQPLESVRNGIETSFTCFNAFNRFGISINRLDGTLRHTARLRFYNADNGLYYTDAAGVDVLIDTFSDIVYAYGLYQHLKVVVDFALGEYVRAIYNTTEIDLRGIPIYQAAEAANVGYRIVLNHLGAAAANARAQVGHVIITTGEPLERIQNAPSCNGLFRSYPIDRIRFFSHLSDGIRRWMDGCYQFSPWVLSSDILKESVTMTGWDAFAKYVGVQGLLALIMTGAIIGLLIAARPVPGEVYGLVGVAWGFYFAKNGVNIAGIGKTH